MRCVSERLVGSVTVLDVASRAMLGELNTEITDRIEKLLEQGRRVFLLNLEGVASLDSNGLGDLVGAAEAARRDGGTLKLASVNERVAHPLRIMNLSNMLEAFDTEEEALNSLEPDR